MVDLLCPALDDIAPTLLAFLARNLEAVILDDPLGLRGLDSAMLAELLGNPCLVSIGALAYRSFEDMWHSCFIPDGVRKILIVRRTISIIHCGIRCAGRRRCLMWSCIGRMAVFSRANQTALHSD